MSAQAPIPYAVRSKILADPYYKVCARKSDGGCQGRITWEHAIMYAGKRVQEVWCILPLCVEHHLGSSLNKALNIKLAMSRATEEDRKKYPRLKWDILNT